MGYYCEVWVGCDPDPWYTMLTQKEADSIAQALWIEGNVVYISRIEDGEEVSCVRLPRGNNCNHKKEIKR